MKRFRIGVIIAALAVIVTLFIANSARAPGDERADRTPGGDARTPRSVVEEPASTENDEDCLSEEQLRLHPGLMAEMAYVQAVQLHGSNMSMYSEVPDADLESLAVQGDSAAMGVLGVRNMLKAHGLDPRRAQDYIMTPLLIGDESFSPDPELSAAKMPGLADFSESERRSAEVAFHWLREAAIHGRYMALTEAGTVLHQLKGNAVEQGWVDAEAYAAMSSRDRNALYPTNVYSRAGALLLPETESEGVLVNMIWSFRFSSERYEALARQIADDIRAEQRARGLSPRLPPTDVFLSLDDVRSLACEALGLVDASNDPDPTSKPRAR